MLNLRTLAAAAAVTLTGFAAHAESLHIRGQIKSVDGDNVTVETAAGEDIAIKLVDPTVMMYTSISLSDVPADAYLSIPSVPTADGNLRALGISVFPEAFRGANEGTMAWDLTAGSRMTNGTVAQLVERGGENVLTVTFGDETQTIYVPDTAPITTFGPSPDTVISAGQNAVFFADDASGETTASLVAMQEDGSLPPL